MIFNDLCWNAVLTYFQIVYFETPAAAAVGGPSPKLILIFSSST